MKKNLVGLAAAVLLLGWVGTANANLIVNGSFEDPVLTSGTWHIYDQIKGWTGIDQIEVRNNVAGTAYDGSNFVELDADYNSAMYQEVETVAGQIYTLSYYFAPRVDVSADSNYIGLFFNDTLIDLVTGDNSTPGWQLRSFQVVGTGSDTIFFYADDLISPDGDSLGGSIDKVSMEPVPEPATLLLLGSGLLGLAGFRKKVKK